MTQRDPKWFVGLIALLGVAATFVQALQAQSRTNVRPQNSKDPAAEVARP